MPRGCSLRHHIQIALTLSLYDCRSCDPDHAMTPVTRSQMVEPGWLNPITLWPQVPWSDTVEPCCDPLHTGTPCHADPGALILHGGVMLGVPGVGDKTLRLSPLALAALEATCVSDSAVLQKHSCPAPDVCYFSRPRYIWKDNAAAPLLCPRPSSQRSPSHILDYNWARRNLPAHRFADAACVILE